MGPDSEDDAPDGDDESISRVDLAMGAAAKERGWLTDTQVTECMSAAKQVRNVGIDKTLAKIMVEKGLITEIQGQTIERVADAGAPDIIAGFELLGKLGEGGMGAVYKAKQISMDRIVALKILPEALAQNPEFAERFIREARMAAKLDHVNIIRGIDVGKEGSTHYFAMEYVEGESVAGRMKDAGALEEKLVLAIAIQITRALEHAWNEAKLIHRDIKPDNIMLTKNDVAKLADLGLARTTDQESTMMTRTGVAMGTPHYISPEQARGERDIDIRTDVYSLGATLYHMLAGETPFGGSSAAAVITNHLTKILTPVHVRNPNVSERVSRVIWKMMRKDKMQRYPGPTELLRDLELVADGRDPALASSIQLDPSDLTASGMALLTAEDLQKYGMGRPKGLPLSYKIGAGVAGVVVFAAIVLALLVASGSDEAAKAEFEVKLEKQLAERDAEDEKRKAGEEMLKAQERADRVAAAQKVLDTAREQLGKGQLLESRALLEGARAQIAAAELGPPMTALLEEIAKAEEEQRILAEKRKKEEAEKTEREARQHEHERLVSLGDKLYAGANYAGALASYNDAQGIQDSDTLKEKVAACQYAMAVEKGRASEKDGDLTAAIAAYQEALKIKHDADLMKHIGELYAKRERAAEAEELKERALSIDVANVTEAKKLQTALEDARSAIKLMGEETTIDLRRRAEELEAELKYRAGMDAAREYVASNRWREAKTAASEALLARPNDPDATEILKRAQDVLSRPRSIVNGAEMKMLWVPAGEFRMGDDAGDEDERPIHSVRMSGIYVGMHEVTIEQYEKFNPKHIQHRFRYAKELDMPVVNVTYRDAMDFCKWLSRREGRRYRLPTEAEWEYIARGTDGRKYPWGDGPAFRDGSHLGNYAKGKDRELWSDDGFTYSAPVGSYALSPSPFGCMDMAGNVWEWCLDWYGPYPADDSPSDDPRGPTRGTERVIRGGSWYQEAASMRTTNRWAKRPAVRSPTIGFRVVMEVD